MIYPVLLLTTDAMSLCKGVTLVSRPLLILLLLAMLASDAACADSSAELVNAVRSGELSQAEQLLLAGADPNATSADGSPVLSMLVWQDEAKELILAMLEKGANPNKPDKDGRTPLMDAREIEVAKLLIAKGANPAAVDLDGNTLLMITPLPELVTIAIKHGVDPNTRNKHGETALMLNNSVEIAKILISNKADLNARDASGKTVLQHISEGHDLPAELLLKGGADPNIRDNEGDFPLSNALLLNDMELFDLLLEHHADISLRQGDGKTPLILAVESGKVVAGGKLLAAGADVSLTDKQGWSALHYAVYAGGDPDMVKMLLAKGADPYQKANDGITPIKLARAASNKQLEKLLRSHAHKRP
jgi:ankyrin repeat protein